MGKVVLGMAAGALMKHFLEGLAPLRQSTLNEVNDCALYLSSTVVGNVVFGMAAAAAVVLV